MAATINASSSSGIVTTADNSAQLELQTASTTRLTINSTGNVGIGTTSPTGKLEVAAATDKNLNIDAGGVGSSLRLSAINDAANANVDLTIQASNTIFSQTGTERMRIDSSGVVTIGGNTVITTAANATFTAGFRVTSYSLGNTSGVTITPNALNSNYQYASNNGAGTIAAPTDDCAIDILLQNTTGAGAITFTGFTVVAGNIGDPLTTTTTAKFIISIRRIIGVSTYIIKQIAT